MRLGELELHSLSDGFFGLDGGAMFGVVPKPIWERTNPADARNRIRLAARPLLIAAGGERILVDTGIGDKWDEKSRDVYRIEKTDTIEASLARAGFKPDDVTSVVLTHLHFDHAGAATKLDERGKPVPRFPNARHYVQRREWEAAINPGRRSLASYRPDDFLPIQAADLLVLVEGSRELLPGLELVLTGGHTPGHQIVTVTGNSEVRNQKPESRIAGPAGRTPAAGTPSPQNPRTPALSDSGRRGQPQDPLLVRRTAVFWGDLIPTSSHIETPYIMGYDLFPLETIAQKERLVPLAIAERWVSYFEHDPDHACGIICEEAGRQFLKPLTP